MNKRVDDIFIWIPKSATTQMKTNDDHFAEFGSERNQTSSHVGD